VIVSPPDTAEELLQRPYLRKGRIESETVFNFHDGDQLTKKVHALGPGLKAEVFSLLIIFRAMRARSIRCGLRANTERIVAAARFCACSVTRIDSTLSASAH
jgi:hypothetical protein